MDADVAIVGAGPAGLSAAIAAGEAGCAVIVVDANARPGGQYYKQLPPEFVAQAPQALHHQPAAAQALLSRAERSTTIQMLAGASVWAAECRPRDEGRYCLHLQGSAGASEVRAKAVILAPGAYDRALPFPGWDLPGVTTVGAAQTLVKSQRVLPGRRVVLSGTGPFLLPVAAALAEAGAQVIAVCEASAPVWMRPRSGTRMLKHPNKLMEGFEYLRTLRNHGVPMRYRHAVTRVRGGDRATRAIIQRLDSAWVPVPGSDEELEVDAVGVGYGFMPSNELSYSLGCAHTYDPVQGAAFAYHDGDMQTSAPGVFVAGEITGIRGSAVALIQGSLAGLGAARRLGRTGSRGAEREISSLRRTYRHRLDFANTLIDLFSVRPGWLSWAAPDTIICRCEEVTFGDVRDAVDRSQARDVKAVKSLTRCGMGPCQGRVCGYAVSALTAQLSRRSLAEVGTFTSYPITRPIPLAEML